MDKGYVVDKKILDQEIIKLTDWYTDELFFFEDSIIIRADFSRIFCDTERFSEDSQEVMAQYGMGVEMGKSYWLRIEIYKTLISIQLLLSKHIQVKSQSTIMAYGHTPVLCYGLTQPTLLTKTLCLMKKTLEE
jgi:hypothetical protein